MMLLKILLIAYLTTGLGNAVLKYIQIYYKFKIRWELKNGLSAFLKGPMVFAKKAWSIYADAKAYRKTIP